MKFLHLPHKLLSIIMPYYNSARPTSRPDASHVCITSYFNPFLPLFSPFIEARHQISVFETTNKLKVLLTRWSSRPLQTQAILWFQVLLKPHISHATKMKYHHHMNQVQIKLQKPFFLLLKLYQNQPQITWKKQTEVMNLVEGELCAKKQPT